MASCRVWSPGEGREVPRDLGKAAVCLVAAGPQRRRRLPQLRSRTLVSWLPSTRGRLWVSLSASTPVFVFGSSCFFGSQALRGLVPVSKHLRTHTSSFVCLSLAQRFLSPCLPFSSAGCGAKVR